MLMAEGLVSSYSEIQLWDLISDAFGSWDSKKQSLNFLKKLMSKLNYGLFDHNNFASISINPFRNKFAEVQTFFRLFLVRFGSAGILRPLSAPPL